MGNPVHLFMQSIIIKILSGKTKMGWSKSDQNTHWSKSKIFFTFEVAPSLVTWQNYFNTGSME